MHILDLIVLLVFLYSVFVLSTDMVCQCEDNSKCQCRRVFVIITAISILYGVARVSGLIVFQQVGGKAVPIDSVSYSLNTSRFGGGGLRLGMS